MPYVQGAVYGPPPGGGLPYVVVLFSPDGEVLSARRVPSVAAGEQLLKDVLESVAQGAGFEFRVSK